MLARLAGILGDTQRQQSGVASDELAQAVLAKVTGDDVEGEVDDTAAVLFRRDGVDEPKQRAHAVEELTLDQPEIREPDASLTFATRADFR